MNFAWSKINARSAAQSGKLHGCVVISQISLNYNGLDTVFQRMRKMQEIATPLSRLAMTSKWDSSGFDLFAIGLLSVQAIPVVKEKREASHLNSI
jgi:hypothetical protein